MYNYNTFFLHIAVSLDIIRFDKLAPCVRAYKQSILRTPVIMGEHNVRFNMIYDEFHILITVLSDGIAEIHHVFRLQQEVHKHVFKSHQEMQPLKYACRHKCHNQLSFGANLFCLFLKRLPKSRIGTICFQIRHHKLTLPFGNIADDFVVFRYMGHRCHLARRPEDRRSEPVFQRVHSCMTDTSDVG